jgi:hypothetical protein
MSVGSISYTTDLSGTKTWTTIKETTRCLQSWSRNRQFVGLTSWSENRNEDWYRPKLNLHGHLYCILPIPYLIKLNPLSVWEIKNADIQSHRHAPPLCIHFMEWIIRIHNYSDMMFCIWCHNTEISLITHDSMNPASCCRCHPWTGECDCKPGWDGKMCSRPCPFYMYGKGCHNTCSCKNDAQCSPINGTCICAAGTQVTDLYAQAE